MRSCGASPALGKSSALIVFDLICQPYPRRLTAPACPRGHVGPRHGTTIGSTTEMVSSEPPKVVGELSKTDEWTSVLGDLHRGHPLGRPGGGVLDSAVLPLLGVSVGLARLHRALP